MSPHQLSNKQDRDLRYILADPYLTDVSGHCLSYLRAIETAAARRGTTSVLVGSEQLNDELRADGILPIFSSETLARQSRVARLTERFSFMPAASTRLFRDLQRMDGHVELRTSDTILLNSLRQQHLMGAFHFQASIPNYRRPKLAVVLHFTSIRDGHHVNSKLLRYAIQGLRYLEEKRPVRVYLLADTEELKEEYSQISAIPVGVVPIPHSPPPEGPTPSSSPLRIAFIGQAREDKGFFRLPALVNAILGQSSLPSTEFHIQAHSPLSDKRYADAARSLRTSGVTLYKEPLSASEYDRLLRQADIVLLPYSPHPYTRQSSGVFAEALALGKVIVAPKGTWMARQLEHYGTGVTFDHGDEEGLAEAVTTAVHELPNLRQRARIASDRWYRLHNADNMLEILDELA